MESLSLARAVESDADEVAELYLASRRDALAYLRVVHTDDETRAWIKNVALKRGETWVAHRCGAIVGFLSLLGDEIEHLYVLPGYYRQGIGRELLAWAKTRRPHRLCLYTFQRNARARAFYESHGFRIVDSSDGARNEEGEPDIRYEWIAVVARGDADT